MWVMEYLWYLMQEVKISNSRSSSDWEFLAFRQKSRGGELVLGNKINTLKFFSKFYRLN